MAVGEIPVSPEGIERGSLELLFTGCAVLSVDASIPKELSSTVTGPTPGCTSHLLCINFMARISLTDVVQFYRYKNRDSGHDSHPVSTPIGSWYIEWYKNSSMDSRPAVR
jgi:hypothetical protein